MRQQLYQFEILLFSLKSHTKYVREPQFAHHWNMHIILHALSLFVVV